MRTAIDPNHALLGPTRESHCGVGVISSLKVSTSGISSDLDARPVVAQAAADAILFASSPVSPYGQGGNEIYCLIIL